MHSKDETMDSGYAALRRLHLPRIWTDNGRAKLLAGIPLTKLVKRNLVRNSGTVMSADSAAAVSLRSLKRSLLDRAGGPPQAIVVASPGSGEGRSFVALNLALAFADEKGRNVLLVDADFRKPSIGNRVRPAPTLGLSEVLEAGIELDHALLDLVNSPLKILPAGAPPREPAELLTSDRARAIFRRLRDRFQTIICLGGWRRRGGEWGKRRRRQPPARRRHPVLIYFAPRRAKGSPVAARALGALARARPRTLAAIGQPAHPEHASCSSRSSRS